LSVPPSSTPKVPQGRGGDLQTEYWQISSGAIAGCLNTPLEVL
jgi:hypothetical protein